MLTGEYICYWVSISRLRDIYVPSPSFCCSGFVHAGKLVTKSWPAQCQERKFYFPFLSLSTAQALSQNSTPTFVYFTAPGLFSYLHVPCEWSLSNALPSACTPFVCPNKMRTRLLLYTCLSAVFLLLGWLYFVMQSLGPVSDLTLQLLGDALDIIRPVPHESSTTDKILPNPFYPVSQASDDEANEIGRAHV